MLSSVSRQSRTNESNTKRKAFQNLCTNRPELGNGVTNSPNGDKGKYNRGTKLTPHEMVTGRRMPRGDRETIEIEDVDKLKSELDKYVTTLTKINLIQFKVFFRLNPDQEKLQTNQTEMDR